MLETMALYVVLITGLYFLTLAAVSLASPTHASTFLSGFASSASLHYLELFIRLLVGFAFVVRASHMFFPSAFLVFGWVLVATTAGLFLVPWQCHRRFAQRAVPEALRHLRLVAFGSCFVGFAVLWSAIRGAA